MIFNKIKQRSFGESIYTGKATLNDAKENERNLLKI